MHQQKRHDLLRYQPEQCPLGLGVEVSLFVAPILGTSKGQKSTSFPALRLQEERVYLIPSFPPACRKDYSVFRQHDTIVQCLIEAYRKARHYV